MHLLQVSASFSAAHAIVIGGLREALHGHDWHVTLTISGASLDAEGLLIDFHAVSARLGEVVAPFANRCLNDVPPFDRLNPTAELLASHIGQAMAGWLAGVPNGGRELKIAEVRITEAIGCAAIYRSP